MDLYTLRLCIIRAPPSGCLYNKTSDVLAPTIKLMMIDSNILSVLSVNIFGEDSELLGASSTELRLGEHVLSSLKENGCRGMQGRFYLKPHKKFQKVRSPQLRVSPTGRSITNSVLTCHLGETSQCRCFLGFFFLSRSHRPCQCYTSDYLNSKRLH